MKKINIINKMNECGIVAVIRSDNREQGILTADAVIRGGINIIEITMTTPGALEMIHELKKTYAESNVLVGAGTVLDPETARLCILEGADFIVSPSLNLETIKLCNRYQIPAIPGIMNVSEIVSAMEQGADVVKLFPGGSFGASMIKALKGPLPQCNIMPSGGVTLENISDWISAGAVLIGTGSDLTKSAAFGDYAAVEETARKFQQNVNMVRGREDYHG